MGHYTLKIHDYENEKDYKLPIMENDKLKEKVNLETIDMFINASYFDNGDYQKFDDKYELKEFIANYHNVNISDNFDIKITYKKKNTEGKTEEACLDVIYNQPKVIQYFSHAFTYYDQTTPNSKDKKMMIKRDETWKSFSRNFENLISNPLFFEYIIKSEECGEYITPSMKSYIKEYYYNFYNDDHDSINARMEVWNDKISKNLLSYKTIRGMQVVIDKYNANKINFDKESVIQYIKVTRRLDDMNSKMEYHHWLDTEDGLGINYLNAKLSIIDKEMPIKQMIQQKNKNKIDDELEDIKSLQSDNYETYRLNGIPEDIAMIIGPVNNPAEIAEALFAEGYSLEDVLDNPYLSDRLGYDEDTVRRHR